MPIETSWLLPDRVTYFKHSGVVTIEELAEAGERGIKMMESSPYPLIHTIQDGRDIKEFPNNVVRLSVAVRKANSHPKMGWMVTVNVGDPLLRYVVTMFVKITQQRQKFAASVPEALEFLNNADMTLPDLPAFAQANMPYLLDAAQEPLR